MSPPAIRPRDLPVTAAPAAQPALLRRSQAEEGHHVAAVRVEGLGGLGCIQPDAGVLGVQIEVPDVPDEMALPVLTDEPDKQEDES